ncbi:hypothetical protein COV16_00545 [Candidatus Woesearchaeota archaeon CG10_big_fil_rev_8_21_14_0_10_34_8]|nr:MAG: hypothetical protein COV16_00545 [Candidatus Woesearchaeota archaeon CG10_big_fil_rev_8_21_14_0_10_34_8]
MKPIRFFNEYLENGVVKKQAPDMSKANFLINENEKSYKFVSTLVKQLGLNDDNANSIIKLCYDNIMEILRAKLFTEGYNAKGQGAHEAEVAYLRVLGFNEDDVQFADQLRNFRNRIMYEGKILDKEYAEKVFEFRNKICPKLKKIVRENAEQKNPNNLT